MPKDKSSEDGVMSRFREQGPRVTMRGTYREMVVDNNGRSHLTKFAMCEMPEDW